jgi:hypothetical protein
MYNKFVQWVWFYIIKRLTKRKSNKSTKYILDNFSDRFNTQLKALELLGGIDLVIFGDSNGEELADYESMKRFPEITANLSIGGTRADHWAEFFTKSKYGREIYQVIKNKKILINVGGNNVLQMQMIALVSALNTLKRIFPNSYWINIPSVYANLIANLQGRSVKTVVSELKEANDYIGQVAGDKLIDIRNFTGLDEGSPYFYVLKDAVHYSDIFDYKIRIPLIIEKVYGRDFRS